jgi:hypothetical protein
MAFASTFLVMGPFVTFAQIVVEYRNFLVSSLTRRSVATITSSLRREQCVLYTSVRRRETLQSDT